MWILLWLQVVTVDTIKYYHLGTHRSLESCSQAKAKAMVMRTTKDTMVACLDVTLEGQRKTKD